MKDQENMIKQHKLISSDDFQTYILNLWKNNEELERILNSTQDGNQKLFKEGFKFGLIWAALSTCKIHSYYMVESDEK